MIRFFDMFSGIGGFRAGLERMGGFECVGHCEIDKFANKSYDAIFSPKGEYFCEDAREIDTSTMPDFDLLCAGFPCQAFSVAGQKRGFDDTRGTLFFEIAKVVRAKRPQYLLLENVPGLLTHDGGRTYQTILNTLSELGYNVEWQILNSKDIGYPRPVPHDRKRLFIIGYLDGRCAGKILPILGKSGGTLKQLVGGNKWERVYDPSGVSCTLIANAGGFAQNCGLYFIDLTRDRSRITENARCLLKNYDKGTNKRRGESSGVLECDIPIPVSSVQYMKKSQNGKRYREPDAPMFTLTTQDRHGLLQRGRIRKLTPRECLRLQGFEDCQIDRVLAVTSNSRVYQQAGNAVTVSLVSVIGAKLKATHEGLQQS